MRVRVHQVDNTTIIPPHLIGEEVTVSTSSIPMKRDGFHGQMSIEGRLEKLADRDQYRVLVTDGNFTYFEPSDVAAVLEGKGQKRQTVAVIFLVFTVSRKEIEEKAMEGLKPV